MKPNQLAQLRSMPTLSAHLLRLCAELVLGASVIIGLSASGQDARTSSQVSGAQGPHISEVDGFTLKSAGEVGANNWLDEKPILALNFSIERSDHQAFANLGYRDIHATIDGVEVPVGSGDLQTSATANVLIVLDGSGSMVPSRRSGAGYAAAVDKLSAAKTAIGDFLDQLRPNDRVAIMIFDSHPHQPILFASRMDKTAAKRAVDEFQLDPASDQHTALYQTMKVAIRQAKLMDSRNVILLTDGMEDTESFRALSSDEKETFTRNEEQEIVGLGLKNQVRLFTIGIGNSNAKPSTLDYVDRKTLQSVSTGTGAGASRFIDLATLNKSSVGGAQYQALVATTLENLLNEIQKSFHYDYTVNLHPSDEFTRPDGAVHTVHMECRVGDVGLPVEFTYTFGPGMSRPTTAIPKSLERVFYKTASDPSQPGVNSPWSIYFEISLFLVALAAIPAVIEKIKDRRDRAIARSAVLVIRKGSPHVDTHCPMEDSRQPSSLIKAGDPVVVCPNPKCGTVHHLGCWHQAGDRCCVPVCGTRVAIAPELLKEFGDAL